MGQHHSGGQARQFILGKFSPTLVGGVFIVHGGVSGVCRPAGHLQLQSLTTPLNMAREAGRSGSGQGRGRGMRSFLNGGCSGSGVTLV